MLQGKYTRKMVAATLLTILMTNTFAPAAFALTSGPTQPEATSFEPIDTTDMVNQQTGDFTYNMPLLEVPGPEGGYPMSLSYHAGIQTNEDASWVGLGWTLNTGAINRNVNGYPDDWKGAVNTNRVFWSGGKTTTYSVGVSISYANNPYSVNAQLSFSSDTYQGFGVGFKGGVGLRGDASEFGGIGMNANLSLGISSYGGEKTLGGGIGAGGAMGGFGHLSVGVQGSTNFESVQAGFTGGVGFSSLGASMSTTGDKPSLSVGGLRASVSSSTASGIETQSTNYGITIPVTAYLSVSLAYSKQRYWTDETTPVTALGSLYSSSAGVNTIADNAAFDTYSLLVDPQVDPSAQYFLDNPDPTMQQGGAYPAFDDYEVNAQGLSGSMRPYQFQGQVLGQNKADIAPTQCGPSFINCYSHFLQYYSPRTSDDPKPQFRFVNDFSNTYQQDYPTYSSAQMQDANTLNSMPLPFGTPVYGNVDPIAGTGTTGFNNNQLAGSKHVDMGIKIKPYKLNGYVQSDNFLKVPGMVEGFTITNESGVTYTFGLPAYSYGEESYQERLDKSNGNSLNRQKKADPYAYTWYLTSVTGPDFVDRNNDGMADDGDWGYWVDFEYGKWTGDYVWRNPSEGYNTDEDNEWQNCSLGHKEVYYLNAVRTRSHVALFEKDQRSDARGESASIFNLSTATSDPVYASAGLFDNTSATSLQLSHIYLLNAADENYVTPASGTLNGNVLDGTDVNAVGRANLESKAIRVIDFRYDYSLCPATANSFTTPGQLQGKLTLLSVATRGKGGVNLLPPSIFQYDLNSSTGTQAAAVLQPRPLASSPAGFTSTSGSFYEGDMVRSQDLNIYCGMITKKSLANGVYTYLLTNCGYVGSGVSTTMATTKNPDYNKDAYDAWGNYKGDISTALLANDIIAARQTSSQSALGTDAWSLRSITTELGSQLNISYEPNNYFNSSADPIQQSLTIDQIQLNPTSNTMVLSIDKGGNSNIHLSDSYTVGDPLQALLLQEYAPPNGNAAEGQDGSQSYGCFVTDTRTNTIGFSDAFGNSPTNPKTGVGLGLHYYPSLPLSGSITVQSIDDINNTITVHCPDNFLMGTASRRITLYEQVNGTLQLNNSTAWLTNSYGGNLFIKSVTPFLGGGIRVKSVSEQEQLTGITRSTLYSYTDKNGNSSGISSYTPSAGEACFDFPGQYSYTISNPPGTSDFNRTQLLSQYYTSFRRIMENNNGVLFSIARELPPPGVMYGDVSESWQVKDPDEATPRTKDGLARTEYQFEVLKGNMVGRIVSNPPQTATTTLNSGGQRSTQIARYYAMDKFISCIGNIKSIIQYDEKGYKLSETDNHYLHDNLINTDATVQAFMTDYKNLLKQFNSQGYIQERYVEVKAIGQQQPTISGIDPNGMKATISAREEYPCIYTGQTVINYVNGTRTSSQNLAFDFYSGAVTQTVETDAYGNNLMTETVPAYIKNSSMALKVTNANNLNMLTQTAETHIWKVDGITLTSNKLGLVSATVNTWSNILPALDKDGITHIQDGRTETVGSTTVPNGNVWRPQSTYSWMPTTQTSDGLTPYAGFVQFNWLNPSASDNRWVKTSDITLYDVYSKSLEASDINSHYAATHMTYGENKVMLTGGPAKYYEIAYSGAEDAGLNQTNPGFIQAGAGTVSSAAGAAHTGTQGLLLNAGAKGFIYSVSLSNLTAGRGYTASVWVKPVSGSPGANLNLYYDIDGGTPVASLVSSTTSAKTAGGWTLVNLSIPGGSIAAGSTLNVWCRNDGTGPAYADDMRFQPSNASTIAYVYDPFSGELTHILDNNNLYARFEYDAAGRLVRTYKEKLNTGQFSNAEFKTNQYTYNYSAAKYVNDPINNVVYVKNNCNVNAGYFGGSTAITIPGGTYTSLISTDDANRIAGIYAQDYANTHSGCFCATNFTFGSNISGILNSIGVSGNTGSFEFTFAFLSPPSIGATVTIGNFTGACAAPTATRTVPVYLSQNGSIYNVTVTPQGNVQITLVSGTAPTGNIHIQGQYGLPADLAYSDQESGTFTPVCQPGYGGAAHTYVVPPYKYAAVDKPTANALAVADVQANGQIVANGFCTLLPVTCSFTFATGITPGSANFSTSNGTVTYSLAFYGNGTQFSQGVVGTVMGGCAPSATRTFVANDNATSGRTWFVTISPSGSVQVSLLAGSPENGQNPPPIFISGTYPH